MAIIDIFWQFGRIEYGPRPLLVQSNTGEGRVAADQKPETTEFEPGKREANRW